MTNERYKELWENYEAPLTQEEINEGWHFCVEWDGLLIGPGMDEMDFCKCLEKL
jgi:hypothetical protein